MMFKEIKNKYLAWFIFPIIAVSACTHPPQVKDSGVNASSSKKGHYAKSTAFAINLDNRSLVREKIMAQYIHWKGVPYRYGGQSKKGIDCSGLVQTTFLDHFGYQIPRTTRQQIKMGQGISKMSLVPGDVIFFKVGRTTLHNGIYFGDGKFLHASSSRGVMFSTLDNPYWRRHYLTARRVR